MRYPRQISDRILRAADHFPAVILTGARQSGKTTLLRTLFPDANYVTLDLPSEAQQAELNPQDFLSRHQTPLIIDEAQYAPQLFRHLKYVIDNDRHAMGQYILTGSQKFLLMKEVGDSLAGRAAWIELENLSLREIEVHKGQLTSKEQLCRVMARGLFPELWRDESAPDELFYSTYLATYLERDVREILNVTSLRDFERFIRILAARSGQLLNKSEVAKDVGVSVKAIGDWVSVLEASNQIVLLEPFYRNISKRMIKSPKVYLADPGLLCFLLRIGEQDLSNSPFVGAVWETLVFSELRKLNRIHERPSNIYFYRDQRATEIDFVLERGGCLDFIECKWSEHPGPKDCKNMAKIARDMNDHDGVHRHGQSTIIAPVMNSYTVDDARVTGLRDF